MRLPSYWPYLAYLLCTVLFLAGTAPKAGFVLVTVCACVTGIVKENQK